ncbi:alpha/beta hydrolase family protein [Paraliomyxa miuraensis]|uniref:alpha/beta hydrolase family protein n=1 Tax=Paraliomyxa miuraensis TaxID=376150 RepID=UPI00224C97F2|nr:alpha/beta fold hydrolase [Paraliomyxa miuraensis]MCX4245163.1 lysophospholipase [Paraliomyxa miuraensis]
MFPRSLVLALAASIPSACIQPPPPLAPDAADDPDEPPARSQVAWDGLPVGELYARGEIRGFELRQGDRLIGRTWGRYVGTEGEGPSLRHRFETRTELLLPGRPPARAEGLVLLDDQGTLVSGHERSDAAELRFERKGNLLHLTDGEREDEVLYEPERRDTAFMAHSAVFHEELMLGLRRLAEGSMSWRVVSLSGGVPVEWEASLVRAPRRSGERAVIRTNLGEEITIEHGRLLRSAVAASGLEIEAIKGEVTWPDWVITGPPRLRYEPAADARFGRREFELPGRAGEPALFGELLIPEGVTTPAPAVLWISGTGREDRHGFAGPPPVDLGSHEITDALAEAGVLVLRFDERGHGRSEAGSLSFSDQLEDARRAFRTLVVQPEVDPDRVVLVAHGEGGLRALSLAAQQGAAITGVALLGSPGRPHVEVLRHQGEAALADVPPELREHAREQQARMIAELAAGTVPPELRDHEAWLREVLALDPARMIARVPAALWLAQGARDFEVDPTLDARALHDAAKARGKGTKVELHRYEQLDHLFKPEPLRSTPARYREPGRKVDPTFLSDLCTWVVSITKPAPPASKRRRPS